MKQPQDLYLDTPPPGAHVIHCEIVKLHGYKTMIGTCTRCGRTVTHEPVFDQPTANYSKREAHCACRGSYYITTTHPTRRQRKPRTSQPRAKARAMGPP